MFLFFLNNKFIDEVNFFTLREPVYLLKSNPLSQIFSILPCINRAGH
jgi:hypothetical protein